MNEKMVFEIFEKARRASEKGTVNWVMSNGQQLVYTEFYNIYDSLKEDGYWTCAIFQYGYRCEA